MNASTELLVKEWCWGRAAGAAEPGRRSGSSWLETGILTHCLDPGKRRGLLIEMEKLYWTLLFLTFFDASIMTFNVSSFDKNCAKKFFSAREYCMSFPFIYELLYWLTLLTGLKMRDHQWIYARKKNCHMLWSALLNMHAMAIIGKPFNRRLHYNLQTMKAFVVTKKHNFCSKNITLSTFMPEMLGRPLSSCHWSPRSSQ